jgi:hypothetical protein
MHEVKVFDSTGRLKKVISVKALDRRSQKQIDTPSLFRKNKGPGRPAGKSTTSQGKPETTKN